MEDKPKKPGTFGPDRKGGRPAGTLNKRTLLVEEIAAKYAISPFEILMMVAAGDWESLKLGHPDEIKLADRVNAAKEASKYLYSQRQSVALSTDQVGFKIVVEDFTSKSNEKKPS